MLENRNVVGSATKFDHDLRRFFGQARCEHHPDTFLINGLCVDCEAEQTREDQIQQGE